MNKLYSCARIEIDDDLSLWHRMTADFQKLQYRCPYCKLDLYVNALNRTIGCSQRKCSMWKLMFNLYDGNLETIGCGGIKYDAQNMWHTLKEYAPKTLTELLNNIIFVQKLAKYKDTNGVTQRW